MTKEELKEELEKEEQIKDKEFAQKMEELCKEYERELLPQIILTPGMYPDVQIIIKRTS